MPTDADGPLHARLTECKRRIDAMLCIPTKRAPLIRQILDQYLPRMVEYRRELAAWEREREENQGRAPDRKPPADPRDVTWDAYDAALLVAAFDSSREQRRDRNMPAPIMDEDAIKAGTRLEAVSRRSEWRRLVRGFRSDLNNPPQLTQLVDELECALDRQIGPRDDDDTKPPTLPAGVDEFASPALTVNQSRVLQTMAMFDGSRLLSSKMIAEEMDAATRLSEETVRQCVGKLIAANLAERPEGDRSGARLNNAGRKLAGKIAD